MGMELWVDSYSTVDMLEHLALMVCMGSMVDSSVIPAMFLAVRRDLREVFLVG